MINATHLIGSPILRPAWGLIAYIQLSTVRHMLIESGMAAPTLLRSLCLSDLGASGQAGRRIMISYTSVKVK